MTSPVEPLDPATPEGAAAEAALNQVLAGVITRLAQEDHTAPAAEQVPA